MGRVQGEEREDSGLVLGSKEEAGACGDACQVDQAALLFVEDRILVS